MDDPRYPVGTFQPTALPLTPEQRAEKIETIRSHPGAVRQAVEGLTDEQLDTPYREGGWTVRQVVHHVVDSHMNGYVRFKLALTEEHPTIRPYDQAAWAELEEAKTAPVELSLTLLDALHARWVAFLETLSAEDFRRTVDHPEEGELTVDTLLELYAWHCAHHTAHITGLREGKGW